MKNLLSIYILHLSLVFVVNVIFLTSCRKQPLLVYLSKCKESVHYNIFIEISRHMMIALISNICLCHISNNMKLKQATFNDKNH